MSRFLFSLGERPPGIAGGVFRALALAAGAFLVAPAFGASIPPAGALLAQGRADQALAVIDQELGSHGNDAAALNLQCRVYFAEDQFKAAQAPCEKAVALQPANGSYHLWLGRVVGREAEEAPAISALGLAKKARAQFEAAYQLDPHNAAAAADLAEFYVDAPGILGGGASKAQAIAAAVEPWAPALAHGIRAEVAEKDKQDGAAERELQLATASPDARPETYVALASFYRKHNQVPAMLATIDKAVALDTAHDDALVSAAEQLTRSNQRPLQAIALLRQYLASSNQSENAPAFQVHVELAQLLAKRGEAGPAQKEIAAAHALASGWQPDHHARNGS